MITTLLVAVQIICILLIYRLGVRVGYSVARVHYHRRNIRALALDLRDATLSEISDHWDENYPPIFRLSDIPSPLSEHEIP